MSLKLSNISALSLEKSRSVISKITLTQLIVFALLLTLQHGYLINQSHANTSSSSTTILYPSDDRNTATSGDEAVLNVHTYPAIVL